MADSSIPQMNFLRNNDDDDGRDDSDVKKGMILVAIVILFLFCMILLRFGCNLLIDVCILRDGESFMRTVSEVRRWFCPCWHPRTEPAAIANNHINNGSGTDIEMNSNNNANGNGDNRGVVTMESLLSGLTAKQKEHLLASIVPCKVRERNLTLMRE